MPSVRRLRRTTTLIFVTLATTVISSARTENLPAVPASADISTQRAEAWSLVAELGLFRGANGFSDRWHRPDEVFAPHKVDSTSAARSEAHGPMIQSGEPEIIILTFYNDRAYRHIRSKDLHRTAELDRLLQAGVPGALDRPRIPSFPADSMIVLTAWWPVARDRLTPLPVWDAELNPARVTGNSYIDWRRVVAVDAGNAGSRTRSATVEFVGRKFTDARTVSVDRFQQILVDEQLAKRLSDDQQTRKATLIALGRPLEQGDHLVMVAMHIAAKGLETWRWSTLWWHDQPERGVFAQHRPSMQPTAWGNYLLDVATDAVRPTASNGGPHICFNPWLEARFPDGGNGGGVVSNCIACHDRASYPPVSFLPVTRGLPNRSEDPAYSSERLQTDFVWSLARQAKTSVIGDATARMRQASRGSLRTDELVSTTR